MLTPGQRKLSQNGLFIKDLDEECWRMMPTFCRKVLEKSGISIDIPPEVQLIDSRADIAARILSYPSSKHLLLKQLYKLLHSVL